MSDDIEKPATAKKITFPIVRDATFVRFSADAFVPMPVSEGIEVSMLQATPEISGQNFEVVQDSDGVSKLSVRGIVPSAIFSEVARLRLDRDGLQNLTRMIVEAAIENGALSGSDIIEIANRAESETEQ